jgi:hypothetical protein
MLDIKYTLPSTIKNLMNSQVIYYSYGFGNVARLDINNKFIYLWQNVKGDMCYCFTLYSNEYYTTSVAKLGNVLTQYFGYEIEVTNNGKEQLKKITSATIGLNKALAESERFNTYNNYFQMNQIEQNSNDTMMQPSGSIPQPYQQHPLHNQEKLYQGVIQLATYYLESHLNTIYIRTNELPIVSRIAFAPNEKQAFFTDEKGLNCKNSFIPTEFMVKDLPRCDVDSSIILSLIFFMAKQNEDKAMKILGWIAYSLITLNKSPFALVLYSNDNIFMKVFYEEIVEPLFDSHQCEKIENSSLDKKSLSTQLHERIIYNFYNITTPTILGEPTKELINRLIHKNNLKLNNKNITTVGNILIMSTTNYIPTIAKDVPRAVIKIDSKLDKFCNKHNISSNYYKITKLIEKDLENFTCILRCLDIEKLFKEYQVIDYDLMDANTDILDGDENPIMVFDKLIRNKDIIPFKSAANTRDKEKIVDELNKNFYINERYTSRIDKNHLLDYFEILFGKGIFNSNTALIAALRNLSTTKEPFENEKTHVRDGRAYYFL